MNYEIGSYDHLRADVEVYSSNVGFKYTKTVTTNETILSTGDSKFESGIYSHNWKLPFQLERVSS